VCVCVCLYIWIYTCIRTYIHVWRYIYSTTSYICKTAGVPVKTVKCCTCLCLLYSAFSFEKAFSFFPLFFSPLVSAPPSLLRLLFRPSLFGVTLALYHPVCVCVHVCVYLSPCLCDACMFASISLFFWVHNLCLNFSDSAHVYVSQSQRLFVCMYVYPYGVDAQGWMLDNGCRLWRHLALLLRLWYTRTHTTHTHTHHTHTTHYTLHTRTQSSAAWRSE